ncbi:MAG TPA: MnhB domain-containing protein [Candidatus Angelobacter sp.]|nr:MnhB domain-containing protein [Candidatus Angelobacter sp.]
MNRQARIALFIVSGLGFLCFYIWGLHGLPGFGHYPGPYGDIINSLTVYQRHATDAITAVNFDYRGFDTLGEEFILFTSVMGANLLLRKQKDDREQKRVVDRADDRVVPPTSDAVRVIGLALVLPIVVFGIYTIMHGQLTPGGGFQGGVILASMPLIIYLCGDYHAFEKVTSHVLSEIAEAIGAGGYAVVGLVSVALGYQYLTNFIPLGETGDVLSSGTILLISFLTGIEVAAGIVVLMISFFRQAFVYRKDGAEDGGKR